MTSAPATSPDISAEFVANLAGRAREAEELRRLPTSTLDDYVSSGLADLLVPARYGGVQAPWQAILDPVRRMAHRRRRSQRARSWRPRRLRPRDAASRSTAGSGSRAGGHGPPG